MTSFTLIMFVLPVAIIVAALVLARTAWAGPRDSSSTGGEADR